MIGKKSSLYLLALVLVVIFLVSPLLASCGGDEQPSTSDGTTTTPETSTEPITLKWYTHEPESPSSTPQMIKQFAAEVEAQTEGRVTLEVFWGAVLGNANDSLNMVSGSGVADGGMLVSTYHKWQTPLFSACGLPFFNTTGWEIPPKVAWDLYNEWPAMQQEWDKVNVKPLYYWQTYDHWTSLNSEITSLDELEGKKLWFGGLWQTLADVYNANNISMSAPEAYDALQKGTIIGVVGMPYHTFKLFRYTEVNKYMMLMPWGGNPVNSMVINKDVWNKISAEDQAAIENIASGMFEWLLASVEKEETTLQEYYKSEGVTEFTLSETENQNVRDKATEPIWNEWKDQAKKQGVTQEEIDELFSRWFEKMEEYK